jgi:hypothetical protein
MRRRSIVLLVAAGLFACTSERSSVAARDDSSASLALFSQTRQREQVGYAAASQVREARSVAAVTTEAPLPFMAPAAASAMLIRTATASIEVDSLEIAIDRTKALAARVGGFVANSTVDAGKHRLRSATLEVKVPAQRFEDGLAGLSPIGKLETVNVSAADVGEEYVDVTARMENARRLERRLIELLANRTGKLKDVLAVEESLARVREEIERYEGRMRYLRVHTAMSTLSVTVHEPLPVVGTAGQSVMGQALQQAWRNFVVLVSLGVQSLGIVIPLGALAVVVWIARRRVMKQRVA